MSNFIDLDSGYRDVENFPNPADYTVTARQVETWLKYSRSIRAFPQAPTGRPVDFVSTVNVLVVTLPYSAKLQSEPRLYLAFTSSKYKDVGFINTIGGVHKQAKFILVMDRIQHDSEGEPIWMHYRSTMQQTMRISRSDPVSIQITKRDGAIVCDFKQENVDQPIDPMKQTYITLDVTPYIRDGDYSNQEIDPITL